MESLSAQLASNSQLDAMFFEITLKSNKRPIVFLEKKEGKFELTLPGEIVVDGVEFLQLLQKGIEEL